MDINARCNQLKSIYAIHDAFTSDVDRACGKHCAACCTCNVTGTTLEAWVIYDHLASGSKRPDDFLEKMSRIAPPGRFQPRATINELVAMCVGAEEPPEECNDPSAGACPLIEGDICTIYTVRPFGCRAMLSTVDCTRRGEAQMPPLVLSVNNVVMQCIEALDRPGASGNMIDILLFLAGSENRKAYLGLKRDQWAQPLRANQPFPVLMIPPEHRRPLQPLLKALGDVLKKAP